MEQQKVEISRGTLLGLLVALMISMMGIAFLLGRQSAPAPVASSQPVTPVAMVAQSAPEVKETPVTSPIVASAPPARPRPRPARPIVPEPSEEVAVTVASTGRGASVQVGSTRVAVAAENGYPDAGGSRPAKTRADSQSSISQAGSSGSAPEAAKPNRADSEAIRKYLSQVDNVMAGTQSLGDPNGFATQLLQQGLAGDTSGFDSLLETANSALSELRSVKAPPSCKEHHQLLVGQLQGGIGLLEQVKKATVSMDTGGLATLSLQGKDMQGDIVRFQQVDRELRSSI